MSNMVDVLFRVLGGGFMLGVVFSIFTGMVIATVEQVWLKAKKTLLKDHSNTSP